MKICNDCLKTKINDEFYKAPQNASGLNKICKVCYRIKQNAKNNSERKTTLRKGHMYRQMINHKIVNSNLETDNLARLKIVQRDKELRAEKIKELLGR